MSTKILKQKNEITLNIQQLENYSKEFIISDYLR